MARPYPGQGGREYEPEQFKHLLSIADPCSREVLPSHTWAALRSGELTDNLVETLVQTIERIDTTAEHRVEQELLADFRRVTGKTGLLFRVAEASAERPDGIVCEVVFPAVGGEHVLHDLVKEYKATGPGYRRKLHQAMRRSYQAHYRRLLPPLLETLEFRSNNAAHRP